MDKSDADFMHLSFWNLLSCSYEHWTDMISAQSKLYGTERKMLAGFSSKTTEIQDTNCIGHQKQNIQTIFVFLPTLLKTFFNSNKI